MAREDHQSTPEERAQQEAYAGARGRRDEIGPLPETARRPYRRMKHRRAASGAGKPERPVSEAERPAEIILAAPSRPEPEAAAEPTRETTDARQAESSTAENVEITDAKAAEKARWARHGEAVEQAIESARDRGYEHSR